MPSHAMPSVMAVAAVTSVRKCAPIISREKATTAVHTAPMIRQSRSLPRSRLQTVGSRMASIAQAAQPVCPDGNERNSSDATPSAMSLAFKLPPSFHHGWK